LKQKRSKILNNYYRDKSYLKNLPGAEYLEEEEITPYYPFYKVKLPVENPPSIE